MARLSKARYTWEFRIHAVSMARDEGLGMAETARRLSISSNPIANWVKQTQEGQDFTRQSVVSDADAENSQLRKENARLRMECEILKKRRGTLPGSRCEIRRSSGFATLLSFPGCLRPKTSKGTNGQGGIDWRQNLTPHLKPPEREYLLQKLFLGRELLFLHGGLKPI